GQDRLEVFGGLPEDNRGEQADLEGVEETDRTEEGKVDLVIDGAAKGCAERGDLQGIVGVVGKAADVPVEVAQNRGAEHGQVIAGAGGRAKALQLKGRQGIAALRGGGSGAGCQSGGHGGGCQREQDGYAEEIAHCGNPSSEKINLYLKKYRKVFRNRSERGMQIFRTQACDRIAEI